MKARLYILIFLLAMICSCAKSSYTVGKDFPTVYVKEIERGSTTSSELLGMFGEPFSKTVISEHEEKWIYMYSSATSKAQSYVVTIHVETVSVRKVLDILLKDGVVVNFTFTNAN